MEHEFYEILQNKEVTQYINNNKYDQSIVTLFVHYLFDKTNDFDIDKDVFTALIDCKCFDSLPMIFNRLLNYKNKEEEIINICNNFSTNTIIRFKESTFIIEIVERLIMFAENLHAKEWFFECTSILYLASRFITNCNAYDENVCEKYYTLIGKIFLQSNNFFSALNAFSMVRTENENNLVAGLINYKNEEFAYSQLLLKMKYKTFENDCNISYGEHWDFYIQNIGKSIELTKENLNFISFMCNNDLSFVKEKNTINIGRYRHKSMQDKVFEIIDLYNVTEEKLVDKIENIKIMIEQNVKEKKTKERAFEDNFTLKKAKYNIYCDILKKTYECKELYYELRNQKRKEDHEKYNQHIENKKAFYKEVQEDLNALYNELVNKKAAVKVTTIFTNEQKFVKKSWREEEEISNVPGTNTRITKAKDVTIDRQILICGNDAAVHNFSEQKKEEFFKPNIQKYSTKTETNLSNEQNDMLFVPNLVALKANAMKENSIETNLGAFFASRTNDNISKQQSQQRNTANELSNLQNDGNYYRPPVLQKNDKNIKHVKQENDSKSWVLETGTHKSKWRDD